MNKVRRARRVALGALATTTLLSSGGSLAWAAGGKGAPPGNNGTVKIDGYPVDSGPDNDPHVSCNFAVNFYGYDSGPQSAAITVTPVAPTGGGSPYRTSTSWNVGTRSTGNQLDASVTVTQADMSSSLQGITPRSRQGYHLRLEVEVTGAQGSDDKYKVFWLTPCSGTAPAPAAASPSSTSGSQPSVATTHPTPSSSATGDAAPAPAGGPVTVALAAGRSAGTGTTTPAPGTARAVPMAATSPAGRVVAAAAPVTAPSGAAETAVPASTRAGGSVPADSARLAAADGGSLAFTGADAVGPVVTGLGLIGVGGATVVVARRRRRRG